MKIIKKNTTLITVLVLLISVCLSLCSSAYTTQSYTPVSEGDTVLKWSLKMGTSYRNAPSIPAIGDSCLFVMSGKTLYKLNSEDGSITEIAELSDSVGYGSASPLYNDGVVYCPIGEATVEAFDCETMEKLWSYSSSEGGQALTNLTFSDGYVFTGFWNGERENADYVCIDALTGKEAWSFSHQGGFYWAECAIKDDYVIFGGDDGTSGDSEKSQLYCLNKTTGSLTDTAEIIGDQRSGVAYDSQSDKFFFVTKAGYIYSVSMTNGKLGELKRGTLLGASTSTPVIHEGRIYIGAQKSGFSGGSICVVDSETLELIYSADMKGYPQNQVLISDAYGGTIYIYSTYNVNPGGITVLTDKKGQTEPEISELFVPVDGQTGFGISSICADEDGTLYYKNDSGYIFALKNNSMEKSIIPFLQNLLLYLKKIITQFGMFIN